MLQGDQPKLIGPKVHSDKAYMNRVCHLPFKKNHVGSVHMNFVYVGDGTKANLRLHKFLYLHAFVFAAVLPSGQLSVNLCFGNSYPRMIRIVLTFNIIFNFSEIEYFYQNIPA